ncbi:MAG: sugar-binding domain-containing protein [Caldimonas sp.]
MKRREFLFGGPASMLLLTNHSWAQLRPPSQGSPAVVNPVFRSDIRPLLSLDGKWDLFLDPDGEGLKDKWFDPDFSLPQHSSSHVVNVPGTWEANGIGKPGLSHPTSREFAQIPLQNEYVGAGWYRKTITMPSAFEGKRVWLKIGGVNSLGMFWANGKYLGTLHTYTSAAYKFEITSHLKQGQNVITAYVTNKMNSRKGAVNWRDQFGGLYRSVEIEATSATYIDDVWAGPDFDHNAAFIHVTLASPWTKESSGDYRVHVSVTSLEDNKSAGSGETTLRQVAYTGTPATVHIALNPFRPWSPEQPSLYKTEVTLLEDGKPIDAWIERFGVRKLERSGHEILLNGKKHFLRGFGDDYIYPLTMSSPASREYHRKHLELARAYGFTFVRNHTHAESPEYYQAADEAGIMIQAELPYEGIWPSPPGPYQPIDDFNMLCRQYRRYVSLSVYSMGNEGLHKKGYRRALYRIAKLTDPTRLVMHQDGGVNYEGISDLKGGPINVPVTQADVAGTMPIILHEYLNLCGPPDPRLESAYTGAEAPSFSLQKTKDQISALGMDWDLVERAIDGGHELQSIYQKIGLENARSVPGVNGYDYWTIADVLALMPQGLLDPFWNPKRSQPSYFRQFNSDIVLLLPDLSVYGVDRVFSSGDAVSHPVVCSNYGKDVVEANATWELTSGGRSYQHGEMRGESVPQGGIATLGRIEFTMPEMAHPQELKLQVKMGPQGVQNEWTFYCFPKKWHRAKTTRVWASDPIHRSLAGKYPSMKLAGESASHGHRGSRDTLVTEHLDETALDFLQSGGQVLLLGLADLSPEKVGARLGWWSPTSNQRGTALAASEAFGDFPIFNGLPNFAIFRLLHEAVLLTGELKNHVDPLSITLGSGTFIIPPTKRPPWTGQVDVGSSLNTKYLVNIFQANVGNGRLLASGFNLLGNEPEADYLLDTFLRYMESPSFRPKKAIQLGDLKKAIAMNRPPSDVS